MTQTEQELAAEAMRLLDCIDNIREMAEARKSCIRMGNGIMLDNYCRQALSEGRAALAKFGIIHPD